MEIKKPFNFEYDSFIYNLAIYILRNKITKKDYSVNFISNGKIIIEPHYFSNEKNKYFINEKKTCNLKIWKNNL